ncbi:bzip transcription factor 53 [Anaeramoeba flamelloides]|uniref:Bzip transcription factor 53 n=1 Tax=Anaeramoeba flamelloides TaxID=1746091 RepID=A0ABQ8XAX8_9EUKA|nr:bzip transcription factor 53 [Anaeramoeba flamelloides]
MNFDPYIFTNSENKFPSDEDLQVDIMDELISSPLNEGFLNIKFNYETIEKDNVQVKDQPKRTKEKEHQKEKQLEKEQEHEQEQGQEEEQEENKRKRTPIHRGVVIIKKKKKKKTKNYVVGKNKHYLRNKQTLKSLACRGLSLDSREKKRRTMERNRINARSSRMRKKQYLNNLENETKQLKIQNNDLTKQLNFSHEENYNLRSEIQRLRKLLNLKQKSATETKTNQTTNNKKNKQKQKQKQKSTTASTSTSTKAQKVKKSYAKQTGSKFLQTIEQASEQMQQNSDFSTCSQNDSVEVSITNCSQQSQTGSEGSDDDEDEEEETESAFIAILYYRQNSTKLSICKLLCYFKAQKKSRNKAQKNPIKAQNQSGQNKAQFYCVNFQDYS